MITPNMLPEHFTPEMAAAFSTLMARDKAQRLEALKRRHQERGGDDTGCYKRACVVCGSEFYAALPFAMYCSYRCQTDAQICRRAERRKLARKKACDACGNKFTASRCDARYCSTRCRVKHFRAAG
jgi:hypothetical protein